MSIILIPQPERKNVGPLNQRIHCSMCYVYRNRKFEKQVETMQITRIIFTLTFSFLFQWQSPLYSYPGDHPGYTCKTYTRTDCEDKDTENPDNAINPACASEVHAGADTPDDSTDDYNFTMFGDSLTDFADAPGYGWVSFEEYFAAMGFPGLTIQNYGIGRKSIDILESRQ